MYGYATGCGASNAGVGDLKIDFFLTFVGEDRFFFDFCWRTKAEVLCLCFLAFSAHFYFSENSELTLMMVENRVDNSILERCHVNTRHFLPSYCT